MDEAGLARAHEWVEQYAPNSRSVESSQGSVPAELILGVGGASELEELDHGRPEIRVSADRFASFTWKSDEPITMQTLNSVLRQLPRTIFRTKGFVHLREKPDHRCILQATARRAAITVGEPWGEEPPRSALVFVGCRDGVDGGAIGALFRRQDDSMSPIPAPAKSLAGSPPATS